MYQPSKALSDDLKRIKSSAEAVFEGLKELLDPARKTYKTVDEYWDRIRELKEDALRTGELDDFFEDDYDDNDEE